MPTHTSPQFGTVWNNLEQFGTSRATSFGTGVCRCFIMITHAFDSLIVCCHSAMPKNGLSAEEWKERLRTFANGKF